MKNELRVLGLMSGTSLDGLDLALCRIWQEPGRLQLAAEGFATQPMPAELKQAICENLEPASSRVDSLCQLNVRLAEWFVTAIEAFCQDLQLPLEQIDLIGSHGQTLYHQPPQPEQLGASLQLGDGSWLAQRTGITTVSQFRNGDMALGGQGAPLAPFLDSLLFGQADEVLALQNLGGMGNVTWLGPAGQLLAFDTGPGNALIDTLTQKLTGQPFDAGGQLAAQGQVQLELLEQWLSDPFFAQAPPRSTGRERFGEAFASQALLDCELLGLSPADSLATISALTSHSIFRAYRDFLPHWPTQVLVSGGGVHNQYLMQQLQSLLAPAQVLSLASTGWNPDAKEALAFACLAYTSLHGICNNLPAVTGATAPVVLGQIAPGRNWKDLIS